MTLTEPGPSFMECTRGEAGFLILRNCMELIDSFQKYRDRYKAGGDFTAYSDILYKKLPTSAVIVIK
ncbi:hypothetical protein AO391_06240 [Pseudomonas marginalis ICMP 9505]|nr:hypothetical protein AO391_06240 [Pseudomonas marginalis ICMP 9505]